MSSEFKARTFKITSKANLQQLFCAAGSARRMVEQLRPAENEQEAAVLEAVTKAAQLLRDAHASVEQLLQASKPVGK